MPAIRPTTSSSTSSNISSRSSHIPQQTTEEEHTTTIPTVGDGAVDEQTQLINNKQVYRVYTPPPQHHPPTSATPSDTDSATSQTQLMDNPTALFIQDTERGRDTDRDNIERDETEQNNQYTCSKRISPVVLLLTALLLLVILLLVPVLYTRYVRSSSPPPFSLYSTCDVFCTGKILAVVQLAGIFNDSKTFVDMPLKVDPSEVYAAFNALPNNDSDTLRSFITEYFDSATSDLLPWNITDWQLTPDFLRNISDHEFAAFAQELNDLWFLLGRQIHPDVYKHPERHTLLPLPSPYVVVPGGRFREFYYWDSYWILRGLLICQMTSTSRIMLDNLIYMARTYGFVPNGSRQYYLTRSQPPFLTLMIDYFYSHSHTELSWLQTVIHDLDTEYQYWMKDGVHAVKLTDTNNETHTLNRYYASVHYPRPEAYREDVYTALALPNATLACPTQSGTTDDCILSGQTEWADGAKMLFSELTASAETGWDFSSRWFADRQNLSSVETSHIIPVDLNSILYQVEMTLSKLHNLTDTDNTQGAAYYQAAQKRLLAMHTFLWDAHPDHYVWRDYDYQEHSLNGDLTVLSNYVPLFTKSYSTEVNVSRVIDSLLFSGLLQRGGLMTSLDDVGQQWDCPNAWAPLQHMIMEGIATTDYQPSHTQTQRVLQQLLENLPASLTTLIPYTPLPLTVTPSPAAAALSYWLGTQWILSNQEAYMDTGYMYEKYYGLAQGESGAGGEYQVQAGFGWSNGVALVILNRYGQLLNYSLLKAQSTHPPAPFAKYPCSAHPHYPSYTR